MTVQRLWGSYEDHHRSMHCVMKTLTIEPGKSISYQFHNYRSEFWYVERGEGEIWINDQKAKVYQGYFTVINETDKHKLINTSNENMIVREMQFGDNCNEEDIVRLNYGL